MPVKYSSCSELYGPLINIIINLNTVWNIINERTEVQIRYLNNNFDMLLYTIKQPGINYLQKLQLS